MCVSVAAGRVEEQRIPIEGALNVDTFPIY